ncbi:hypothetical protein F511_45667 [Dorcoceras hygrometricum]|uniref:Uncharacterized protein n=1 Tax=Dorcoceras hygrometricum TaxID=472368 RepID=A0A2Z7A330_9LAMI|nr:hypothetical protein F511_45667 [Dorcoceras hygrometricum]
MRRRPHACSNRAACCARPCAQRVRTRERQPARPVRAGGAAVARTTVHDVRAQVPASGRSSARRPVRVGRARWERNARRIVRAGRARWVRTGRARWVRNARRIVSTGYTHDPAIPAAI